MSVRVRDSILLSSLQQFYYCDDLHIGSYQRLITGHWSQAAFAPGGGTSEDLSLSSSTLVSNESWKFFMDVYIPENVLKSAGSGEATLYAGFGKPYVAE